MLNAFKTELMKVRKSKIFIVCTLISIMVPIFIIFKDAVLLNNTPAITPKEWIFSGATINILILPLMGGFIITYLIQREYQEQTITNVLNATIIRRNFVISKLLIWLVWYIVVLLLIECIYIVGYYIIYPNDFNLIGIKYLLNIFSTSSMLNFITFIPLMIIALKQRKIFYPAIMFSLAFIAIQAASFSISSEMLLLGCIFPWSASSIVTFFTLPSNYQIICYISISLTGIFGILGSIYYFNKQDI